MSELTHLDRAGRARMVDVGDKPATAREAVASARVRTTAEVVQKIAGAALAKGDVLAAARIAGIMAAKRTAELIPLCHPLGLDTVAVDFSLGPANRGPAGHGALPRKDRRGDGGADRRCGGCADDL